MPQFEVELSDGTVVTLEADKQPSEQEVISALKPLPTSAPGAFSRALATGIGPGAAAAAAFTPSFELGTAALAPEAGPLAPIGGLITGLAGAGIAGGVAAFGQKKLLQATLPRMATSLERLQASDVEQHPLASAAGGIVAQLPSMEVALPRTLAEIPKRAALQAGLATGQTLAQEQRLPTAGELTEAAVAGTVLGGPRAYLRRGLPYARSIQQAAEVHGDLRPQPVQGAGQVPIQEGGAGVQPQAKGGLAQPAQVSLTRGEAELQGPEAIRQIMVNHNVDRDTAVAMQSRARQFYGISKEVAQAPVKKGPTFLTGQKGEVGEDPDKGWYVQFGNRRQYGFGTVFEAKKFLDGVETGQHTIVGEMVPMPEDNIAAATYTDPETLETTIGPHHPGAAEEQDVDAEGPRESREGPEFGFMTEGGEKLTRPEAETQAGETGQAMPEVQEKPGVPHSDEIQAPGVEHTISETSDLDAIMDKIERGQKLTPAEEALFDAQINSPGTTPKVKGSKHQLEFAVMKEANKAGKKADIRDDPPTPDATVPFANNIAYIDPKSGRLVINRQAFMERMAKIPQQEHSRYIERLINEEHLHSLTSDEDARAFHDNATEAERRLAFRQYTGFADNAELFRARGTRLTDTQLGHEMIRQRLQQLSGLSTREIVELSGREKWNARFIDALQRLIYNLRKKLGTRASRMQQDIINRMQGNLDAVKQAQGEPMGAFFKGGDREEDAQGWVDLDHIYVNGKLHEGVNNPTVEAAKGVKHYGYDRALELWNKTVADQEARRGAGASEQILAWAKPILEEVKKLKDADITFGFEDSFAGAFNKRPAEDQPEYLRTFIEDLRTGRVANTNAANAVGMKLRSVDDLGDLGALRQSENVAMRKAVSEGNPAETMFHGMRAQYAREAIETATNTGSHVEEEARFEAFKFGKRPLDWRDNPEVADWLKENGPSLGIKLPAELAKAEAVGAFRKGGGEEGDELNPQNIRDAALRAAKIDPRLGIPMWEGMRRKLIEERHPDFAKILPIRPKGDNMAQIVMDYANMPAKDWPLPEGLKDQLDAWFKQQEGTSLDRASLIDHHILQLGEDIKDYRSAIAKETDPDMRDQLRDFLYEARDRIKELETLKGNVLWSRRVPPENYFTAAFKKESKKEREARIARERATEALPGFGGPAYAPQLPLKGEKPPPPSETLAERQQSGFEGVTPKWLEGDVRQYFDRTDAPSFKDWVEDLNARGIHVEPYQMGSVYEDATANHLQTASGDKLTKMAKALGVDVNVISRRAKKEGKRVLTNVPDPPEVERQRMMEAIQEGRPREAAAAGELGFGDLTKADLKQMKKTREGRERFRNRVISALWSKMVSQILPPGRDLRRSTLDLEDVAWSDKKASEGPFYQFTNQEANDPTMVKAIAGDQARRSEKENQTISRRVLVMVDKNTGKVEEASVYRSGKDLMVMRPTIAGISGHRKLTELPKSLRPLYTILLGDPVQEYHKGYKSIADFNEHWDIDEAKRRNTASEFAFAAGEEPSASFALPAELDVERTPSEEAGTEEVTMRPATQAAGGRQFIAPGGKYGPQGEFQERAGEIARAENYPLSPGEASALMRVAMDNEVSEPEDFKAMVDIMAERQRQKQGLRGEQASALSALHKIVDVTLKDLQEAWEDERDESARLKQTFDVPPPTAKEAYEVALKDIFHTVTRSKGLTDALQTLLGEYRREARPDVQLTAPTPVSTPGRTEGISREVTMRQPPPRMPPTRFPLPRTAEPPLTARPEQLPPEAVPGVEARTAKAFPYAPTGELEPGRALGKPTGRILKYGAPGFRTKGGLGRLLGPRTEEPIGAFYKRPLDAGEEAINQASRGIVSMMKRNPTYDLIAALRDYASNSSNNFANKVGNFLRLQAGARAAKGVGELVSGKTWGGDKEKLAAAIPMVQSGFDYDRLAEFRVQISLGEKNAKDLIKSGNWWERIKGRKWLEYQQKLMKEVNYADDHWDDPELQKLAKAAHAELDAQYNREKRAGHNVKYDPDYIPGRYEAEFWNDNATVFGQLHDVLGRNWKAPKTFRNYYEASAEEPYLGKSRDVADLVEHRVRQGMNRINYDNWVVGLKNIPDPDHPGQFVAADMIRRPDKSLAPANKESVGMPLRRGYQWISVRKGYEPLIRDLINSSEIQNNVVGRNALSLAQALKHTMLIGDVFHLGRVLYYGQSLAGRNLARFRGGLSAIEYREQDLPQAVKAGLVSPAEAKWAQERITVKSSGHPINMSRIQIADLLQKNGLNNGRILDALYKETVGWVPGVGRYNRWLFDRVTRGFITQSAVMNFERFNKANPNLDASVLARDIAKDINAYYGNLGRQGIFKSQTYQDIARLAFLAPQWVEGLVRKEAGFYARLGGAPFNTRGKLPQLGALGTGIGTGLLAMIGMTQAINMVTRKKPTWENDEKGHKFDAFIPTNAHNPDEGFWFSPLAIFNELSHDVIRMIETKPKAWDILSQIGENKLSPYGRIAMIGARSQTPTGQYLTTTPSVLGEMGKQLLPTPISASKPLQMIGHAIAPGTIPQTKKGALVRQLAATAGLKIEPNVSPAQQAHALADQFMLDNPEYKKDSGWKQVQTDEPNYSKLRSAIRNEDDATAKKEYEFLRKSRSYQEIVKAMKLAARRPFTGSHANERRFLYTLTPAQLDLYSRAQEQRQGEYESFLEWLSRSEVQ